MQHGRTIDTKQAGMDERLTHMLRDYRSGIVPFAETVIWRALGPIKIKAKSHWGFGIWLGHSGY